MTTEEVIEYYGGDRRRVAEALGVWVSAVYQWGEEPPLLRQYQLEAMTDGALRVGGSDSDHD